MGSTPFFYILTLIISCVMVLTPIKTIYKIASLTISSYLIGAIYVLYRTYYLPILLMFISPRQPCLFTAGTHMGPILAGVRSMARMPSRLKVGA